VTNGNAVSGFVISDPDYTDGGDIADGESDFMQVTVRITDTDGTRSPPRFTIMAASPASLSTLAILSPA
jgi:hypothetical protein